MIEEIYFENVRRTAMVLIPKPTFYDWVRSMDGSQKLNPGLLGEPDVYLLPDFETPEDMELWLNENYDYFFCEQMNNWWLDDNRWVKNRTFKMFKEYFDYSLHTMVWDCIDGPIEKLS